MKVYRMHSYKGEELMVKNVNRIVPKKEKVSLENTKQ